MKHLINELFEKSVPIRWKSIQKEWGSTGWHGEFEINGKKYEIEIVRQIGDRNAPWEIEFYLNRNGVQDISITKTGDANIVFGTVIKGIQQWMQETNPDIFTIGAAEPKRQRVYSMMLDKLLGKEWTIKNYGSTFLATKETEDLEEIYSYDPFENL